MTLSAHDALVLLALLGSGAALLAVAAKTRIPYPILLVLGGLALGFLPGIPHLALDPQVVLVAILPPLLYSAAFFTSLRDLRANIRPRSLLALGLVRDVHRLAATLLAAKILGRDAESVVCLDDKAHLWFPDGRLEPADLDALA